MERQDNPSTLYFGLFLFVGFVYILLKENGRFDVRKNISSMLVVVLGVGLLIPLLAQGYSSLSLYYEKNSNTEEENLNRTGPMSAAEAAALMEHVKAREPNITIFIAGLIGMIFYIKWVSKDINTVS